MVNDLGGTNAQAKIEIIAGPNGTTPKDEDERAWLYVRSFNSSEDPTAPSGYYPEKQQGGFGAQRQGSSVAVGDFNCDGQMDIATGLPDTSINSLDNRPAKQGKVVVYFSTAANTTPSTTTRVQQITFDITGVAGDAGRDLRLVLRSTLATLTETINKPISTVVVH